MVELRLFTPTFLWVRRSRARDTGRALLAWKTESWGMQDRRYTSYANWHAATSPVFYFGMGGYDQAGN